MCTEVKGVQVRDEKLIGNLSPIYRILIHKGGMPDKTLSDDV